MKHSEREIKLKSKMADIMWDVEFAVSHMKSRNFDSNQLLVAPSKGSQKHTMKGFAFLSIIALIVTIVFTDGNSYLSMVLIGFGFAIFLSLILLKVEKGGYVGKLVDLCQSFRGDN